jgi:type II secretory pathway pseudopilin PulG
VTLLELLVVATLIGIFASVVAMRFGRTLFSEFGANSLARELSLDLLTCQRAAITTGDDHFLSFVVSGGNATSYSLIRDTAGGDVLVDGPKTFSEDVTVTVSHAEMRFNFEGSAAANYSLLLTGQNRQWQVDVVPITGAVSVAEI